MPSNNVGGVAVTVRLDDKDALKELNRLKSKIQSLQDSLAQKRAQRDAIAEEMEKAEVAAERARQRVEQLKAALAQSSSGSKAGIRAQLTEANAELRTQVSNMDRLNRQWQKLDADITTGENSLGRMTESAAGLERQVAAGTGTMARLNKAAQKAASATEKAFYRVGRMIRRVFVFSLITRALRALREYLSSLLMSTPAFADALGELKSALLTLAQPLVSILIPVLTTLLQIVTRVVQALATLVSKLFGTTYEQSQEAAKGLYDQADAYKAAGSAAKKASKQLLAFDELNVLSDNSSAGGAVNEAAGLPQFNLQPLDDSQFQRILTIVEAIGAAIAAWKIGSALGLGLQGILGLFMAIIGTAEFVKAYIDAWDEGIDWGNFSKLCAGLIAAFLGVWMAFGPIAAGIVLAIGGIAMAILGIRDAWENGVTWENMLTIILGVTAAAVGLAMAFGPVAAGIALIVGGAAMLVAGIKDIMTNGLNLKNGLLVIAGILAAGLGISLLVGGPIPLLIAAIVAVITAITMLGGTFDMIVGGIKQILSGLIDFIAGVFTGDWERAWEGLKNIFYGIVNIILGIVGGLVNVIIKGLNWLIGKMNNISFDVPDWVPGIGGMHVGVNIGLIPEWEVPRLGDIPALAAGAVIPPNREFMAVLGDQHHGTNIEAPLETMVQAFRAAGGGDAAEAIMQMGNLILAAIQNQEIAAYLDGELVSRQLYSPMQLAAKRRGANLIQGVST